MSETAAKLLEQIRALPEEDQQFIADELNGRLDGTDDLADDPEFLAELTRRSDAAANGTAELVDAETVFQEARERLRRRRES